MRLASLVADLRELQKLTSHSEIFARLINRRAINFLIARGKMAQVSLANYRQQISGRKNDSFNSY